MTATPETDLGTAPEAAEHWRRLSPRMLIVHPLQEVMRLAPVLVGVIIAGSRSGRSELWGLIGVAIAVLLGVGRWATTSYQVTPHQVQVRQGLLRRRVLVVALDRVRTVDLSANVFQRVLRLSRVTVGTGHTDRNKDGGLRLDALDASDAARLRDELLHRRHATPTGDEPAAARPAGAAESVTIAEIRPSWLRFGPFTLSGLVGVGAVLGVIWNQLRQADVDIASLGLLRTVRDDLENAPLWLDVTVVAVGIVLVVAVLSTIMYAITYGRYRLTREPHGTLHVVRGLLAIRSTTIEERRLHGVELREPLLLRAVGGARCDAVTTGIHGGRGSDRGGALLLPPAPRAEAYRVAADVLHGTPAATADLVPHGARARQRRFTRALIPALVLTGAVVVLARLSVLPDWTWHPALALLPVAALLAVDRYRSLGHAVVDGRLVTRQGSVERRRATVAADGIIGWNISQSFFQRRAGLATLTATTAGGRQAYDVLDVDEEEATRLADGLTPGLLTPFLEGPA
ncbi:PH domain-containing protein [Actinoplanes sp. NPDC049548]|uniref:PH domain-containing protein n=1 Tax=Actinoplanes sp. NPDC049548 TaxID=3155152 RepID=UPI0034370E5D